MFEPSYIQRFDYKIFILSVILTIVGFMMILSTTVPTDYFNESISLSPMVKNQFRAFCLGLFVHFILIAFDYRKLRQWTIFIYIIMVILLLGLFFMPAIHNVRRWYRFPLIPFDIQPSEYAKLVVVMVLSWYLEKESESVRRFSTFFKASLLVFIPFALIFKQPDLGTALILIPITLGIFYLGGIHQKILRPIFFLSVLAFFFVLFIFLGVFSHEDLKPYFSHIMKEYQYERLNPSTYHQIAGQTAVSLGHFFGSGFLQSEFTGKKFLPYAYTDSIFPAFVEQFGLFGAFILLGAYLGLIFLSFAVVKEAKDFYGKLLASGVSIYLAMHVIINVSMMIGLAPITGVPLILMSYGGSSMLSTWIALGLLQSIYARRFTF